VPDGDGWRISGRKKWVTNGERADLVVVFARAGEADDAPVGAFLVDGDAEGYVVTDREKTMGFRASETVAVRLEEVPVGPGDVVGEPDRGLHNALETMQLGRVGVAAVSLGIAQASLEHAVSYALEREQFGRSIGRFGGIQEKLAHVATRVAAGRSLLHEVARELEEGGRRGAADRVAMAKLLATETAVTAADEAVQIYGGYGYMKDYPVEKLLRDAKGTEIFEGTSEIMRVLVARGLLDDGGGG